jgi:hypothetical protein
MGRRKLYPIFNSPFTTVENWAKKLLNVIVPPKIELFSAVFPIGPPNVIGPSKIGNFPYYRPSGPLTRPPFTCRLLPPPSSSTAPSALPLAALDVGLLHRLPRRRACPPAGHRALRPAATPARFLHPPLRRSPCPVRLGPWPVRLSRLLRPTPAPLHPTGAWPLHCLRLVGVPSTVRVTPLRRAAPVHLPDATLFRR